VEALDPGAGAGAAGAGAGAGAAAGAAAPVDELAVEPRVEAPPLLEAAAAVAFLSIPPCPLHAPRPPWGEVVPSLQVTGLVASAELTTGSANSAALANAP